MAANPPTTTMAASHNQALRRDRDTGDSLMLTPHGPPMRRSPAGATGTRPHGTRGLRR